MGNFLVNGTILTISNNYIDKIYSVSLPIINGDLVMVKDNHLSGKMVYVIKNISISNMTDADADAVLYNYGEIDF